MHQTTYNAIRDWGYPCSVSHLFQNHPQTTNPQTASMKRKVWWLSYTIYTITTSTEKLLTWAGLIWTRSIVISSASPKVRVQVSLGSTAVDFKSVSKSWNFLFIFLVRWSGNNNCCSIYIYIILINNSRRKDKGNQWHDGGCIDHLHIMATDLNIPLCAS